MLFIVRVGRGTSTLPTRAIQSFSSRSRGAPATIRLSVSHDESTRGSANEEALAVLGTFVRAGDLGRQSFAAHRISRLTQLLEAGGAARFRARYERSGALVALMPVAHADATFLSEHFGAHRVLVVETMPAPLGEPELAPQRLVRIGDLTYELVASKLRANAHEPSTWHFVAVSGGGLAAIDLAAELQRVADFGAVEPVCKRASRLQLLVSRAARKGVVRQPATKFELIADISPTAARGAAMADGCGFAPDALVRQLAAQAGALDPQRASAVQVRVYAPSLGVFKGMLMARPGLDRVQLTPSMRKAQPASEAARARGGALPGGIGGDEALLLVKLVHPTRANTLRERPELAPASVAPASVAPATRADEFGGARASAGASWLVQGPARPLPPSPMVLRLWGALGMSPDLVHAYCARSSAAASVGELRHASLSGVADPFASLPAGTVFAPGIPGERLFVTRFPCVKAADGRVLPLVTTRPQSMLASQWAWLQTLPFGMLLFSVRGERPLPDICGAGDLDGDRYFACWDEELVLPNLTVRPPTAKPRPGGASKPARPAARPSAESELDLEVVYAHLTDESTLEGPRGIGRIYRLWESTAAQRPAGIDDPDALVLADAYLQALNAGKHGGELELPSHLQAKLDAHSGAAAARRQFSTLRQAPPRGLDSE
jgi:hypothetical protein